MRVAAIRNCRRRNTSTNEILVGHVNQNNHFICRPIPSSALPARRSFTRWAEPGLWEWPPLQIPLNGGREGGMTAGQCWTFAFTALSPLPTSHSTFHISAVRVLHRYLVNLILNMQYRSNIQMTQNFLFCTLWRLLLCYCPQIRSFQ